MARYTQYEHYEMAGSPKEEASTEKGGGFSATVDLLVPWGIRTLVAADIVGNAQAYPRIWQPNDPSAARAVNASVEPFTAATTQDSILSPGMASYQYAKLTIKYKLQAETSDFCTESVEPSAEFMTLPPQNFARGTDLQVCVDRAKKLDMDDPSFPVSNLGYGRFASGKNGDDTMVTEEHKHFTYTAMGAGAQTEHFPDMPKPKTLADPPDGQAQSQYVAHSTSGSEGPGRLYRKLDYTITFYRVCQLPWWHSKGRAMNLFDLIDCVNDRPIATKLMGITFQPETLLFNPPTMRRRWNYTSFPYWELTYKFTYMPGLTQKGEYGGWNRYWNETIQDYDYLYTYDTLYADLSTSTTGLTGETTHAGIGIASDINANVTNAITRHWKRYRNFQLADFTPAFNLDMNLSPWQQNP